MKIALVHDQMREFGGAERVLVALKKIYPDADVFTAYYDKKTFDSHGINSQKWNIKTSWFDKIPVIRKLYSPLRFITPLIWESFDFASYNLVISSTGTMMCKGIITKPNTLHISYIHHPPRYLYYYETALEWQKYLFIRIYGHIINKGLRIWDYLSSQRPDYFISNSQETTKRVQKFYRRDSTIIYPPVDLPPPSTAYTIQPTTYFIIVSRLAGAKHIDLLIKTANKLKINLKVVGKGRQEEYLRTIAGPTVEIITDADDIRRNELLKNATAFLFSSINEEFGIAPVEALGYGVPVIAYASGGLKETIQNGVNGYLYNNLTEESIKEAIIKMQSLDIHSFITMRKNARTSAEQYSFEVFKQKITSFVDDKLLHNNIVVYPS